MLHGAELFVFPIEILFLVLIGMTYYYREIKLKYDIRSKTENFTTLFAVFTAVVQSEIDLYEKDVFENNRPITNSNFENFYTDLTVRIKDKLSPELMVGLQHYITEEAIYSYIARTVKRYLVQFVDNPL